MRDSNQTINCIEFDRCADSRDEEKICTNATVCYNLLIWNDDECCQKKGCFTSAKEIQFYCNKKASKIDQTILKKNGYEGNCCYDRNFCNGQAPQNRISKEHLRQVISCSILILITIILISLLIYIWILLNEKRKKKNKRRRNFETENQIANLNLNSNLTSGSGAGYPLLMQRTLAKEIQLECQIAKGKFGQVWRGNYQNRKVAVKLFHNSENMYNSWKNETEIYNHHSLASDYILKYLGSDITSTEFTEFWIIFDYHEMGSLYDYLQKKSFTKDQAISIMFCAISGLVHLQDLYEFTTSKPSIAHRDLKSKNLLMKSQSTVCIADFGLSLTSKGFNKSNYENFNIRSGTKRYMPPEILQESIDVKSFKAFLMADIYSFSLLLWEIIVHSELNPQLTSGYKLPYYEYVDEDPSFEEMKKIVSIDEKRPSLEPFLQVKDNDENSQMLIEICELIRNCWQNDANKRYDFIKIRNKFNQIITKSDQFSI